MSTDTQRHDDPIVARLEAALAALIDGETASWPAMFAEDGEMAFPFAPPGYPTRLAGREAIAAFIATYPEHIRLHRVGLDHAFRDGDTRTVEFHAEATAVSTGRRFTMRYVGVIETRDGLITRYRDYWDGLVAVAAMGGADAVAKLGGAR